MAEKMAVVVLFFVLRLLLDILTVGSLVALDILELSLFISDGVELFSGSASVSSAFLRHS